jgi:HSP20 family protein
MAIMDITPWRRGSAGLLIEQDPLFSLQREMNRAIEEFWNDGGHRRAVFAARSEPRVSAFFPDVDISESAKYIDLTAELPGMREKELRVSLSENGDLLTIAGEKKAREAAEGEAMCCAERHYGKFQRTIALPKRVDGDQIEARCKDGILTLHMRKLRRKEQGTREIPVNAG